MSVHPRPAVALLRIYEPPTPGHYRVLVDRLWPRGISRDRAVIDQWLRDIAPSTSLRTWYRHDPARFAEFADRYRDELKEQPRANALTELIQHARTEPLALVTATKDTRHSHAAVLLDLLQVT